MEISLYNSNDFTRFMPSFKRYGPKRLDFRLTGANSHNVLTKSGRNSYQWRPLIYFPLIQHLYHI